MVHDFGVSQWERDPRSSLRGSMRHYPPEGVGEKIPGYFTKKSDVWMYAMLVWETFVGKKIFSHCGTTGKNFIFYFIIIFIIFIGANFFF
jgi:hypothetical protein